MATANNTQQDTKNGHVPIAGPRTTSLTIALTCPFVTACNTLSHLITTSGTPICNDFKGTMRHWKPLRLCTYQLCTFVNNEIFTKHEQPTYQP